jgi:hypothetical protein
MAASVLSVGARIEGKLMERMDPEAFSAALDRAERAIIGPVERDPDAGDWFFTVVAIVDDHVIGGALGSEMGRQHIETMRAALLRSFKAYGVPAETYDDARRMAVYLAEQFPSPETAALLARH